MKPSLLTLSQLLAEGSLEEKGRKKPNGDSNAFYVSQPL
jgi:hypothetical protein